MCLLCVEIGNVAELHATRIFPLFREILAAFVCRAKLFKKITLLESVPFFFFGFFFSVFLFFDRNKESIREKKGEKRTRILSVESRLKVVCLSCLNDISLTESIQLLNGVRWG